MNDDAVEMSFEERHLWAGAIIGFAAVASYVVIIAVRAQDAALTDVAWGWPMVVTVGAGAAAYAVVYLALRSRVQGTPTDTRDLEISRFGELFAKGLLDVAVLATLLMLAFGVDSFWVAQTLFFGSYTSSTLGSFAKLSAHRQGMPS